MPPPRPYTFWKRWLMVGETISSWQQSFANSRRIRFDRGCYKGIWWVWALYFQTSRGSGRGGCECTQCNHLWQIDGRTPLCKETGSGCSNSTKSDFQVKLWDAQASQTNSIQSRVWTLCTSSSLALWWQLCGEAGPATWRLWGREGGGEQKALRTGRRGCSVKMFWSVTLMLISGDWDLEFQIWSLVWVAAYKVCWAYNAFQPAACQHNSRVCLMNSYSLSPIREKRLVAYNWLQQFFSQ